MKAYLLISRLRIHNANAMSSTLTIGVPAMTAWLGQSMHWNESWEKGESRLWREYDL